MLACQDDGAQWRVGRSGTMALKLSHEGWVKLNQRKNWGKLVLDSSQLTALSSSDCHLPNTDQNEYTSSFQ